jgi:hypothetical protein
MESRISAPDSCEGFRDIWEPPILADKHAEAEAAEADGAGGGAGVENALVVEHAVIGEFVLGIPIVVENDPFGPASEQDAGSKQGLLF